MTKANAKNNTPVLTQNQDNLRLIDLRLRGLRIHNSDSAEITRMNAAREDVMGNMTAEEIETYTAITNPVKSKAELAAEQAAEIEAMNANKDKPSI